MYDILAKIVKDQIIRMSSSYYETNTDDWTVVGQSDDKDAYTQYQIFDDLGICNYEFTDGQIKERDKTQDIKFINSEKLNRKYITGYRQSVNYLLSKLIDKLGLQDDDKIQASGFYSFWTHGSYSVGDIRNWDGQIWECWTAHDNAIYPDINPDNPQTWANFWRPLHGKTAETARPWTKPWAGTTDMYHAGEYMVYTDDKIYKCLSDTVYSPEEYAQAWEVIS